MSTPHSSPRTAHLAMDVDVSTGTTAGVAGSADVAPKEIVFRKRARKGGKLRIQRVLGEDDKGADEGVGQAEADLHSLEEKLEDQRLRSRRKGLEADKLLEGDPLEKQRRRERVKEAEKKEEEEKPKFGLIDADKKLTAMLDGGFRGTVEGQTGMEDDPNMLRFIEERLRAATGDVSVAAQEASAEAASLAEQAEDAELYKAPTVSKRDEEAENSIRGGALPFSTGIAEVALTVDDRFRVLRDTERAAAVALKNNTLHDKPWEKSKNPASVLGLPSRFSYINKPPRRGRIHKGKS